MGDGGGGGVLEKLDCVAACACAEFGDGEWGAGGRKPGEQREQEAGEQCVVYGLEDVAVCVVDLFSIRA